MKQLAVIGGTCILLLIGGCSSTPSNPTPADTMRDRAGTTTDSADQWDKADALEKTGRRQIEKGEKQLEEARDKREAADQLENEARDRIADGNNKIVEGKALKESTEAAYAKTIPQESE